MSVSAERRFRYRASDAAGTDISGEIDAVSERDAVDALRRRALWVITIEPLGGVRPSAPDSGTRARAATVWMRIARLVSDDAHGELAVSSRALATLLDAGVPLDRALAYAAGQSAGDGSNRASHTLSDLQRAFATVRESVRSGDSLSAAVSRHAEFPTLFAPTLAAGEASGTLGTTLSTLADHLDRAAALRARLRAALAYPALLGVASVAALVTIMLVVVPRFASLVADTGGSLPTSTRLLVAAGAAMAKWWWAAGLVAVVAAVAIRGWLRNPANRLRWDHTRLGWPVVGGLERTRAAASYTGVLALALRAGIPLLGAMGLARRVVRNGSVAARLLEAEERVRTGAPLAASLQGILPELSVRLLDAGEAGGELSAMAGRASDSADSELQRVAGGAVALVEPALILAFGGIVGFVALALLQAIYGLNAQVL